ncbi:MAG TPA: outer membrane beta-barrel protein [Gallionellaceae bacterium]
MRHTRWLRAAGAMLALLGTAAAQADPDMFAAERTGQLGWHIGVGQFTPAGNSQLGDQEGKFDLLLGMSYRTSANLAWDIDLLLLHQNVDTPASITPPLWGTVDSRSALDVTGIAGGARYIWPLGRWEPYLGGGLGVYEVRLNASGQQFGIPEDLTVSSTELGVHALAGIDYAVSAHTTLGCEMRYVRVQTSLGSVLPGTLEAGGRTVSLVWRSTL